MLLTIYYNRNFTKFIGVYEILKKLGKKDAKDANSEWLPHPFICILALIIDILYIVSAVQIL